METISAFFAGVVMIVTGWFQAPVEHPPTVELKTSDIFTDLEATATATEAVIAASTTNPSAAEKGFSKADLLAMANNDFADGALPLGDMKYVTKAPKKGYIYLCRMMEGVGGAGQDGPWIKGDVWDNDEKISVSGKVTWSKASFKASVAAPSRTLTGNGLPNHTTGTFPVKESDPAYVYDRNPNSIKSQKLSYTFPASPQYSETPFCMGGEAGVMLTGVPIFSGFDAGMRDAAAHEVQDSCDGHPQMSGRYHYHSLSSCVKDISVTKVLGYALDGFPITGPLVEKGKYLTTEDLDVCHGLTSEITIDGKKKMTYHYVMTQDFPYSVSCFRGKPLLIGEGAGVPIEGGAKPAPPLMAPMPGQMMPPPSAGGSQEFGPPKPPAEAIAACIGKKESASCSFKTPQVQVTGACRTVPDGSFACVPR